MFVLKISGVQRFLQSILHNLQSNTRTGNKCKDSKLSNYKKNIAFFISQI